MKPVLNILLPILLLSGYVFSQTPSYHLSLVEKSVPSGKQEIRIPMSFAQAKVLNPSVLKQLNGKKIERVELVYTRYKRNPSFNQQQLNETRIGQLSRLYPQVVSDNPEWIWVEQTGAATSAEAKEYFHGFIIHYSEPHSYKSLRAFFDDTGNPAATFDVSNSQGGKFTTASGSTLHIPANSVQMQNGTQVKGNYSLEYTEYRNAAEIAFSGIPMTFSENGTNFLFNSAGMYEIRAYQQGQELQLCKPVTVDFNCTQTASDVSFYQLDDASGSWDKKYPVVFTNQEEEDQPKAAIKVKSESYTINCSIGVNSSHLSFSDKAWELYRELKKTDSTFLEFAVLAERPEKRQVEVVKDFSDEVIQRTMAKRPFNVPANDVSTLLAEGLDKGHTYPALVRGLNSPEFGVYNCDQQYRLGNPVSLKPVYVDSETGNEIRNGYVACVIDLKVNGSFSFDPNYITCDSKTRNVIILFTKDNEVYLLSAEQFALLNFKNPDDLKIAMTRVTDTIKTSDDLKMYLAL